MKKIYITVLTTFLTLGLSAQNIQQLKDSAATFPPMPSETVDLLPFVSGAPTFASGTPFSDLEYSLFNVDYIDGENGGSDVFMPVNPSDQFPGSNTVKLIRCVLNTDLNENYGTADRDRIILGTHESTLPFFLRGADGIDNDYAVILHFDYENGAIQLKGSPSDYGLVYCDSTDNVQTTGWYLFYTANKNIDLIAFIYPCDFIKGGVSGKPPQNLNPLCSTDQLLDLTNSTQFSFTSPISNTIALPDAIAQIGTNGKEIIGGITADTENNAYIFGHTDGDINGNNASGSECFVTKVAPDGSEIWTFSVPVTQGTIFMDAVTDDENVYICGRTLGSITGFSNSGRWDGILFKLDKDNGNLLASNQWGNAGIDGYGNIELDNAGNLFVSGQGSPTGPASTNALYLVAKHQCSDLSNVWRQLDPTVATGFSASAEAWGGLSFKGNGTSGEGRLVSAGWYMSAGGANLFISVYENLTANVPTRPHSIILNSPGRQTADWILDNAIDSQNNIYVAGYTTGNLGGTHLGQGDAFVIKYSPQLTNPIYRQFGTSKSDLIRKILIKNDTLYAIGYTYGNYIGNNADQTLLTGDIFVQKLDNNLNLLNGVQFGTPHEERGYGSIQVTNLFIGGMTEGFMAENSFGSFDGFLAALNTTDLSFIQPVILSANDSYLSSQVKLYPNPASDRVYLDLGELQKDLTNINIFNVMGQNIRTERTMNNEIDVSSLLNGLYFMELQFGEKRLIKKMIKE